jgi:hypothetical protein
VIDSGLYTSHEDIQRGGITGTGSTWNSDGCGHGTHVTGTITALGGNGAGVVGVNPLGVNLHIVRVFGDDCGWTYSSDLADAINRCMEAGSNVISMSLGGGRKSRLEQRVLDSAWSKGVLSVAAAGNDGDRSLSYPASYPSVVSVGAVDSNKQVATFSQFNREVDLAAPGVGVLSTLPFSYHSNVTAGGTTFDGAHIEGTARTAGISGTLVNGGLCDSANAAWSGKVVVCQRGSVTFAVKVSNVQSSGGVAAVIYNNKPTWTNAQIREALERTAQDLGAAGRDNYYGHGLVQAKAALDYLRSHYP